MSKEDARTIFSNIGDLALFSDLFSEELERALGGIVEGGEGVDYVGRLFIDVVCLLSLLSLFAYSPTYPPLV